MSALVFLVFLNGLGTVLVLEQIRTRLDRILERIDMDRPSRTK